MTQTTIISGSNKCSHLEMIQGIITRMGGNLFFLKGWAITLVIGLFAVSVSISHGKELQYLLLSVLAVFWTLDAYFLSLERKYRALYNKVRLTQEDEIDFSMDVGEFRIHADKTMMACFLSPTLIVFYPVIGIAMLLITSYLPK